MLSGNFRIWESPVIGLFKVMVHKNKTFQDIFVIDHLLESACHLVSTIHGICAWHKGQGHREVKGYSLNTLNVWSCILTFDVRSNFPCGTSLSNRGKPVALFWRVFSYQTCPTPKDKVFTCRCYGNHTSSYGAHVGILLYFAVSGLLIDVAVV